MPSPKREWTKGETVGTARLRMWERLAGAPGGGARWHGTLAPPAPHTARRKSRGDRPALAWPDVRVARGDARHRCPAPCPLHRSHPAHYTKRRKPRRLPHTDSRTTPFTSAPALPLNGGAAPPGLAPVLNATLAAESAQDYAVTSLTTGVAGLQADNPAQQFATVFDTNGVHVAAR